MRTRALLLFICALLSTAAVAADARARSPIEEEPAPEEVCSDHCWLLTQMTIHADGKKKTAHFELTGEVLAKGPQNIPLFDDPSAVRIRDAKVNGGRATVGFENDQWYLHTAERHFTLTGTLVFEDEARLSIVGPVNAVDVDMKRGAVSSIFDGKTHFSAVEALVLTFGEEGEVEVAPETNVVSCDFSRAFRVGAETTFEYRLNFSAVHELGVQKFPLRSGEEIATVDGVPHWEVAGGELILHPTGTSSQVTVRGKVRDLQAITPDARAAGGEWLLVESDLEHEVNVIGDATVSDIKQSPIGRTAQNSRLFRLLPGHSVRLGGTRRGSHDVLAAVIDRHERQAVLTAAGDLVMSDVFTYDNSALFELALEPHARPIFLALDNVPERVLYDESRPEEVNVHLDVGRHTVKLQSIREQRIRWLGGRLDIPMPSHVLSESSATMTLGLPASVHPVLAVGGDGRQWFVGNWRDALAAGMSIALALLAFSRLRSRVACAASAFGLWCVSPGVFAAASVLALGSVGVRWAVGQSTSGRMRKFTVVAGALATATMAWSTGRWAAQERADEAFAVEASRIAAADLPAGPHADLTKAINTSPVVPQVVQQTTVSLNAVKPVELPMPGAARSIRMTRELMTRDNPFAPKLYFVTDSFLWLAFGGWLAAVFGLAWANRASLVRFRDGVRSLLTTAPPPASAPAGPYRTAYRAGAACVPGTTGESCPLRS